MSQSKRQASAELVTYAARLVRAVRRAADPDVPAASLRLLSVLDELGPSTVKALAEADRTSQPTMTSAVQAVVDRGWAEKRPHPRDARSAFVSLTAAGRERLAAARLGYGHLLAPRLAPYTTEDLAKATALVKHLLES